MDHVNANIGDVASETNRVQQFLMCVEEVPKNIQLFRSVLLTRTQSNLEQSVLAMCTQRVLKALMELVDVCIPEQAGRDQSSIIAYRDEEATTSIDVACKI
jgi:hypothetical protein